MRATSLAFLIGNTFLAVWVGCGGNVVVDTSSEGTTTSTSTVTTGTSTVTTGTITTGTVKNPGDSGPPTFTCPSPSCTSAPDGCDCHSQCTDGIPRAVVCEPEPDGGVYACTCVKNGQQVGNCQETSMSCDILGSCCGVFLGGGQGI